MEGSESSAAQAGTWKIEGNKVVFTFDKGWLERNPANIHVAANFSFQLKNKNAVLVATHLSCFLVRE